MRTYPLSVNLKRMPTCLERRLSSLVSRVAQPHPQGAGARGRRPSRPRGRSFFAPGGAVTGTLQETLLSKANETRRALVFSRRVVLRWDEAVARLRRHTPPSTPPRAPHPLWGRLKRKTLPSTKRFATPSSIGENSEFSSRCIRHVGETVDVCALGVGFTQRGAAIHSLVW